MKLKYKNNDGLDWNWIRGAKLSTHFFTHIFFYLFHFLRYDLIEKGKNTQTLIITN